MKIAGRIVEKWNKLRLKKPQWEKKILGLGSPKMDKVMETAEEDCEIPEEWMHVLEKPDGSSLVQLCQSAGMPVMIQNVEIA